MSRKRNVIRRTPSDRRPPQLGDDQPVVPSAPVEPPLPAAPAAAETQGQSLDLDSLEALAGMDRSELEALLGAADVSKPVSEGDQVTGTVTRISGDTWLVDIGAKSEATLPRAEVDASIAVGDQVTAFVASVGEQGIQLSGRLTGAGAAAYLETAKAAGTAVDGVVIGRNPGGFDVMLGDVRAFCPISQIDTRPSPDPDVYVGRSFPFRILEFGDDVVVSRRDLLREAERDQAASFWITAAEGDSFTGTVRNLQPFGAFVDIGGVDGLLPRREIEGIDVQVGTSVEVKISQLDRAARRITLTLPGGSGGGTPWALIGTRFVVDGVYEGSVTRVEPWGAFVQLAPGLRGLLHASKADGHLPKLGDDLRVRILEVDVERQRLDLAPADAPVSAARAKPADAGGFGTLGDLLQGWKKG